MNNAPQAASIPLTAAQIEQLKPFFDFCRMQNGTCAILGQPFEFGLQVTMVSAWAVGEIVRVTKDPRAKQFDEVTT